MNQKLFEILVEQGETALYLTSPTGMIESTMIKTLTELQQSDFITAEQDSALEFALDAVRTRFQNDVAIYASIIRNMPEYEDFVKQYQTK